MGFYVDKEAGLKSLNNPLILQAEVLEELGTRMNSGGTTDDAVVDPNNVFCFLLEGASNATANFALAVENELAKQLALRAQTSEEIYKHMSDFDYVNMFSSPAEAVITLTLSKTYILDNAVEYNENTLQVIIPKDTYFKIGKYKLGIFYPIIIQVNKSTKNCLVMWDTSEANPLKELMQNIIPKTEMTYQTMELLSIAIPVSQFTKVTENIDVNASQGFTQRFKYTDKFFGIRLFTVVNGKKVELRQTLSDTNYDPYTLTAAISLEPETSKVKVSIPQIYFTSKLMGDKLTVEIYTTLGKLDADISTIPPEGNIANFALDGKESVYSKILSRMPVAAVTAATKKISGGSNGYGLEELRSRAINNAFYTSVLVSPMDLTKHFQDLGFSISKYLDNLTNRIYFAYKLFTDESSDIVPVTHAPVKLYKGIESSVTSIKNTSDGSLFVLPTTLYKYDDASQSATPVTDGELLLLNALPKKDLVDEFNNIQYVRYPFHYKLSTVDRYPKVTSYNLMNPLVNHFIFDRDNDSVISQMVASNGAIAHLNQGSSGYLVRLTVFKSSDLNNIPESDLLVWVYTTSMDGRKVGTVATYVGTQGSDSVYEFKLETGYDMDDDGNIYLTNLKDENSSALNYKVPLTNQFKVSFLVKGSYYDAPYTEAALFEGIPQEYQDDYLVMARQKFTITLGYRLDDVIYNNIDIHWANKQYQTYAQTEYHTYDTDIYQVDENGIPVYAISNGQLIFNRIHKKGDFVLDADGNKVVKHLVGEVILDENNKPILLKDRNIIYYTHLMLVDACVFLSEETSRQNYSKNLTEKLESYFDMLRQSRGELLEQTQLYFRPIKTLGSGKFGIGDGNMITLPLNMSFGFRCHVPAYVLSDPETLAMVEKTIIATIEEEITGTVISLTDIASKITKKKLPEYVKAMDVLGINGDIDLQTLTVDVADNQVSIDQTLYVTKDNKIAIKKNVNLEYVAIK